MNVSSPSRAWSRRPGIGIRSGITSGMTPASSKARMPRAAGPSLIERPAGIRVRRISGKRSYPSTRSPRGASKVASRLPASPAPMICTSAVVCVDVLMARSGCRAKTLQCVRERPDIDEAVVERDGCDTNDVGVAPVADVSQSTQALVNRASLVARFLQSQRQLTAARLDRRWRDDLDAFLEPGA